MLKSLSYPILLLQITLMNFILIEKSVNTHEMNFKQVYVMKHGKMYLVVMMMIQIRFLITFYDDTIKIVNNFLNTFFRKFYAIFSNKKRTKTMLNSNAWITTGIKSHVIITGNYTYYVGRVMVLCGESNGTVCGE